jgi:hypothetical protein
MTGDATADPAAALVEVDQIRKRGRLLAHGGAWLPALALAALPLLSIVLYRRPLTSSVNSAKPFEQVTIQFPFWAGLPEQQHSGLASYAFWLLGAPLAFLLVAQWYRRRERSLGVRVPWRAPVAAGTVGLLCLLALFAAPTGGLGSTSRWWQGLLTPLLAVAAAAIVLGVVERSVGITVSGFWMGALAWQNCALGSIGGLLGWQSWLLDGGSGPGALGGQLTVLGLDRPAPALVVMALPLFIVGGYRAVRTRG